MGDWRGRRLPVIRLWLHMSGTSDIEHKARPSWATRPQTQDRDYWDALEGGAGGMLDLYFAEESTNRPLVVFQHIQKTAGTSLRHLIFSNKGDSSFHPVPVDVKGHQTSAWHESHYASLGELRHRLVCAAGHTANYLVPLVVDRPVVAFTLVRDPVNWVMSRYYFFSRERAWSLEDVYGMRGNPMTKKLHTFSNAQAKSLLAPHHDTRSLPALGEHGDADLWSHRLFDLVDGLYVVGLQDRFLQSVELFGQHLGWANLYPAAVRVNWMRPREPGVELAHAIRRYNWLDEKLYRRTRAHFDSQGPGWEEPSS